MIHYFPCTVPPSLLCIVVCYLLKNLNIIEDFEIKFTGKCFIRLVHFGGKSYMYLNLIILMFIILVCDYMFCPLKLTFQVKRKLYFLLSIDTRYPVFQPKD